MKYIHVYLAGPIRGKSYEGATSWRDDFARCLFEAKNQLVLKQVSFVLMDPMRSKEHMKGMACIGNGEFKTDGLFVSQQAIATRDEADIALADIVVFNLLDDETISIGTCMEMGLAKGLGKIGIVVRTQNSRYDHPLVNGWNAMTLHSLPDAASFLVSLHAGVLI